MGLFILLRTNDSISYFRRNLLRLIRTPKSKKLLLCSGYIWENKGYSILDDGMLNAIKSQKMEVITVAGMLRRSQNNFWEHKYNNFIKKLQGEGIKVKSYRVKKDNWHAKVAIKSRKDGPIAGLIGSSNLTGPAYRENYGRFNYEADILIWKNKRIYNTYFREDAINHMKDPLGPIDTVINPDVDQSNEHERLEAIYQKIMNIEELEPFETY